MQERGLVESNDALVEHIDSARLVSFVSLIAHIADATTAHRLDRDVALLLVRVLSLHLEQLLVELPGAAIFRIRVNHLYMTFITVCFYIKHPTIPTTIM